MTAKTEPARRNAARWIGGATGAAIWALVAAPPALAEDVYGSGAVITNRNCPASSDSCIVMTGDGPRFTGDRLQPHQYFGGYGQGLSATRNLLGGASGSADVSFGDDYLPTIRLGTVAGAETRTGSSATTFRSFTYAGDVAIDFAIRGDLHFLTSGDIAGVFPANEFTGDGTLNVVLALMRVDAITSVFSGASSGIDIISSTATSFPDCGGAGVLAVSSYNSTGVAGGEYNQSFGLSEACSGGAIRLNPGESFAVIASLQAISNRGGYIDATHTFRVSYDEENTFFAGTTESVGEGFLSRTVAVGAAVPEPATWALMIGGFGLAGTALRRRERDTSRAGRSPLG